MDAMVQSRGLEVIDDNSCRVAYPNVIPEEKHNFIRREIVNWLYENDVASQEEIVNVIKNHKGIMNPDKWIMIRDNPEHYWGLVAAYGLGESHEKEFGRARGELKGSEDMKKYIESQLVWLCVGMKMEIEKRRHNIIRAELRDLEVDVLMRNSPFYRAFYTTWLGAMHEVVSYSWAKDIVDDYKRISIRIEEGEKMKLVAKDNVRLTSPVEWAEVCVK